MSMILSAEYLVPASIRGRHTAAIYVSVTTSHQLHGPAYQRQVENCTAFAEKADLAVGAVFEDADILETPMAQRPGMQQALAWLDAQPQGVLIVEDVDRLRFSADDADEFWARIDQADAEVVFVEEQRVGGPTEEFRLDIARAIQDYRAALVEQVMERSILLSPETQARLQARAQRDGQDIHQLADALLSAALAEDF